MTLNNNCDGAHCVSPNGEVRVYPISDSSFGGNMIFCRACWAHENAYRRFYGIHYGRPEEWPQRDWDTARVYGGASDEAASDSAAASEQPSREPPYPFCRHRHETPNPCAGKGYCVEDPSCND